MDKKVKEELIQVALSARDDAYCPITGKGVGASLLTKEGKIYFGCNVQSVISGEGCCAEKAAIYNAVSHGAYNFEVIVIAFPGKEGLRPCGSCLQLIHEFAEVAKKDIKLIVVNEEGKVVEETSINKLLPKGYGPRTAGYDVSKYERDRI